MDVPRRRPRRRWRRFASLGLAALAAAAGITVALRALRSAAPSVEAANLWVDTVKRGPLVIQVRGTGTLVPEEIRFISAPMAARVSQIVVRPGTQVAAATVLLELTNPDAELAALEAERELAAAEAGLVTLQAELDGRRLAQESQVASLKADSGEAARRARANDDLAKKGYLSEIERRETADRSAALHDRVAFEQRRLSALERGNSSQVAAQRAQVERLRSIAAFRRKQLDEMHVRAGIDGVLTELPLQVGQTVTAGALLARVVRPDRLKAELRVAELEAKDVQIGLPADIDTRSGKIRGRVARIDPTSNNGTVKIDIALDGTLPKGARPDLSVDGVIEVERLADVLQVGRPVFGEPHTAVKLYRLVGANEARRVPVKLGRASVTAVEIESGLRQGDRVILSDTSQWEAADRVRLRQ